MQWYGRYGRHGRHGMRVLGLVFGQTHSTGKSNISDICVVVVRLEVLSGKDWKRMAGIGHKESQRQALPCHSESASTLAAGYYR